MALFFFWPQGYQSASKGVPLRDPTPDYNLIKASEGNGYTSVEFDRSATTDGDVKDVQFRVRFRYSYFKSPSEKARKAAWRVYKNDGLEILRS